MTFTKKAKGTEYYYYVIGTVAGKSLPKERKPVEVIHTHYAKDAKAHFAKLHPTATNVHIVRKEKDTAIWGPTFITTSKKQKARIMVKRAKRKVKKLLDRK